MSFSTNKLVRFKRFVGCVALVLVVGGCSRLNGSQSEVLPIDAVNVNSDRSLELVRSDNGEAYKLCGVEAAAGFEDAAKQRVQALLNTPDVDVMLQEGKGNTYEAFLVGLEKETSIEEQLLIDGLLVTGKDVERCPNGSPRLMAQEIAQKNKSGVWGGSISSPVSAEKP